MQYISQCHDVCQATAWVLFMHNERMKTSNIIYFLAEHESWDFFSGSVQLADAQGENARTFSGVANSGKPFLYRGKMTIVDFANARFKDKMPMLIDHDRAKRAGVGVLEVKNHALTVSGSLLSNDFGNDIAQSADQGFPWELSADVRPARVEEIKAKQTAIINGQHIVGPMVVLREPFIREISFTATGVDAQTQAVVLADALNQPPNLKTGAPKMNLEEALAEIARLKAQIAQLQAEKEKGDEAKTEAVAKLAELQSALHAKEIEAKLAEVGFKRNETGWIGLSQASQKALLASSIEDAFSLISDLKASNKPAAPEMLFAETTTPELAVKLSDNPLLANAQARNTGDKHYV